jgi:hypothetical protein
MGRLLIDLALSAGAVLCGLYAILAWRQGDRFEALGLVVVAMLALGLLLSRGEL